MTENQSNAIIKNPHTKAALAVLRRYAEAEAQLAALKKASELATATLKDAMIEHGVDRFEVDEDGLTGYVTLAERTNYKAEDITAVEDQFLKQALDTDKVKAQAVLTGKLPAGVSESKTQFITKKLKVTE